MALRVISGFDYFDETQIARVTPYYSNGTSIAPGRFGGRAWGWNDESGFVSFTTPNASTIIMGVAFQMAYGDPTNPFIVFQDATTSLVSPITQIDIRVTSDAAFQITRNGSLMATSLPNLFTFGFWNYLEIKVYVHNTNGYVQIRLNGQTYLNQTSLDTQYTGNNYINMVRFQSFAASGLFDIRIDDIYICDDTTSLNNDFRGECRVQTQYPIANGDQNDFQAIGAGTNYQAVDESPADDDVSYVRSGVVGDIDNYDMGDIDLTGTIYGVQLNVTHRKDDVGTRTITPTIKSNGTYFEGNLFNCGSDYTVAQKIWEQEPDLLATWTNTSVSDIKAGLKIKG